MMLIDAGNRLADAVSARLTLQDSAVLAAVLAWRRAVADSAAAAGAEQHPEMPDTTPFAAEAAP